MALITTLNINLANISAVLNIQESDLVENIAYENDKFTFDARNEITISLKDYIDFVEQIRIFQESLLTNFSINQFLSIPFSKMNYYLEYKPSLSECYFKYDIANSEKIIDGTYDASLKNVAFKNRIQSATMEFPEWIIFIFAIKNFRDLIKVV